MPETSRPSDNVGPTRPAKPAPATAPATPALSWQAKVVAFVRHQLAPFAFVVLVLCSVRSSIADWNDVPTGSMNPTILEGDRIFVNKLAYDLKVPFTTLHLARWSDPARGDVVVFFAPNDGTRMVKRVVGLPGDTVELRNNRLYVNGGPADYGPLDAAVSGQMPAGGPRRTFASETVAGRSHPVMTLPTIVARRSFGPVEVPAGRYFMMGDNRD